eukprot:TRINITY_DN1903_c0_g1_i1.p1 TRINITY_DN1903_c0_g1~~TRINITY_DN1903_c0_g1_i1.p1  ORF type:complete len:291 (+),score=111.70 TRINITY_DN1903_c0_g1_i1:91-963(+)
MGELPGATDAAKLEALCSRKYKDQGVWFLNAYWNSFGEKEANNIWEYVHKMGEFDLEKHAEGSQLDELNAHRFLEKFDKTLTVSALRTKLQSAGVDRNTKTKYIPLTHFLVIHYDANWKTLVNASIGDPTEVEKAQKMLEEVQALFAELNRTADIARQAEAELDAALRELKAQEDEYNSTTENLKRKSEEGGQVSRNRAKNELAQHLGQDPLPLRRAKITTEAAHKKADKAKQEAEAAEAAARQRLEEAEAYLEEVRSRPGSAKGALWWIDRELHEAKAFLPQAKGGYKK